MICNQNAKNNGKRLVAAVAVVAVMICVFAVVLSAGSVSADDETAYGTVEVPTGEDVFTIDADTVGDFDWSAIADDDSAVAYVSPNASVGADLSDLRSTAYLVGIDEVGFRVENARFDG